jgi:hypothetical protein
VEELFGFSTLPVRGALMWFCEICKHTERHIPGVADEAAKVKRCRHCSRCRENRKSLQSVVPEGISYLMEKYRRR